MEAVNIPIYGISDVAFVLMDSGVRCINVMGEINARWVELEDVAQSLQLTNWKEVREEDLRSMSTKPFLGNLRIRCGGGGVFPEFFIVNLNFKLEFSNKTLNLEH